MSDQFSTTESAHPATGGFAAPGGGVRQSIRDRIAAVEPYSSRLVEVPEWGVTVQVRSLSLGERNDMLQKARAAGNDADISVIYPEMVLRTSYDPETGDKVFSDDDTAFINNLPANLMDKLALPAMELSGMTETSMDDAAKK